MDDQFDIKMYRERWKALAVIKKFKMPSRLGRKYHFINRLMIFLGIMQDDDVEKMQVILRWAKLRELYEQGRFKGHL